MFVTYIARSKLSYCLFFDHSSSYYVKEVLKVLQMLSRGSLRVCHNDCYYKSQDGNLNCIFVCDGSRTIYILYKLRVLIAIVIIKQMSPYLCRFR